ncbi:hypothetical protein OG21DRAFT_552525 [Imleria badia]|nr:hypothetical protein OG21DRAFT_552525 [Imleria badia]
MWLGDVYRGSTSAAFASPVIPNTLSLRLLGGADGVPNDARARSFIIERMISLPTSSSPRTHPHPPVRASSTRAFSFSHFGRIVIVVPNTIDCERSEDSKGFLSTGNSFFCYKASSLGNRGWRRPGYAVEERRLTKAPNRSFCLLPGRCAWLHMFAHFVHGQLDSRKGNDSILSCGSQRQQKAVGFENGTARSRVAEQAAVMKRLRNPHYPNVIVRSRPSRKRGVVRRA